LPAPVVTNTISPNNAQRFLGEFGGPPIGVPDDPGYNHTRVDQTVSLSLTNLPAHSSLQVAFDLYILKSWDGNSPAYGRDRFILSVSGAPALLDTTFSNNPKTNTDGSYQDYPATNSPPWAGIFSTNTLGYSGFFYDGIYRLQYTFAHTGSNLTLNFRSSLFEGKGTGDESWGLDNVSVATVPQTASANIYRAVEINWDTLANASHQVQWVPYVDATNWTNLGAPVTAPGTNLSVFDATRGRAAMEMTVPPNL
jgi:hypothetical protein